MLGRIFLVIVTRTHRGKSAEGSSTMYEAVALPKYKVHSLEIRAGAEAHTPQPSTLGAMGDSQLGTCRYLLRQKICQALYHHRRSWGARGRSRRAQ